MKTQRKNIFVLGAIAPSKISEIIAGHQSKTEIGAHSIFLGQVRDDMKENGRVTEIEYSAYVGMALEKAQRIREEIFEKYSLTCMHIYHSLGRIKTGEICLFLFTSAPRRQAATEACTELLERIKRELPIWGKEIIGNESHSWKVNNYSAQDFQ